MPETGECSRTWKSAFHGFLNCELCVERHHDEVKVLHVIPSVSPSQGGPSFALPLMIKALLAQGVHVDVVTTNDDGRGKRLPVVCGEPVPFHGARCFYFSKQTEFYKVSVPMGRWLRAHVAGYDAVHVHALFSFASLAGGFAAKAAGVPYIIRPLGVLNRWGMENRRRWLKRLSFRFLEGPLLDSAAAIHYTSQQERDEAHCLKTGNRRSRLHWDLQPEPRKCTGGDACFTSQRELVIPLGIDVEEFALLPEPRIFLDRFPQLQGKEIVLFLSRLDEKKGLDVLLPAFAQIAAKRPQARLVLAGDGAEGYVRRLRHQVDSLGIIGQVVFAGFLAGEEKRSAFAAAQTFVLPSYSENFGIAAVEALASGVPCVLSQGVAIAAEVRAAGAGITVKPSVDKISAALEEMLGSKEKASGFGAAGKTLASRSFSIQSMGEALRRVYEGFVPANNSGKYA